MSDNNNGADTSPKDIIFNTSYQSDEILSTLSNIQRRRIILYLQQNGSASQSKIARQLAAWKYGTQFHDVSDSAVERAKINLHHKHLPELQDAGLIDYDRQSGKVLVRDLPELAEVCLNYCESADLPS